jgi:hypothetical protein
MSTQEQPTQGHTPVPFKELLEGATQGRWRVKGRGPSMVLVHNGHTISAETFAPSLKQAESNAAYIARCNPATMAVVYEALNNYAGLGVSHPHLVSPKCYEAIALLNGTAGGEKK